MIESKLLCVYLQIIAYPPTTPHTPTQFDILSTILWECSQVNTALVIILVQQWLSTIRQQVITRATYDPDLYHNMLVTSESLCYGESRCGCTKYDTFKDLVLSVILHTIHAVRHVIYQFRPILVQGDSDSLGTRFSLAGWHKKHTIYWSDYLSIASGNVTTHQ